jgi:peptidoglycan/LPS O-acetylase OafA/YrhL
MSETGERRHIFRSIGAVLAGMVVGIALTLGTDELLHIVGGFPPWGQSMVGYDGALLLETAYRVVYAVLGSYITARLAPNRPMLHALIGGAIGFVVSIVGAVATWNGGPPFGPHWYPLALILTALPCAWAGGKLRIMQLRSAASVAQAWRYETFLLVMIFRIPPAEKR